MSLVVSDCHRRCKRNNFCQQPKRALISSSYCSTFVNPLKEKQRRPQGQGATTAAMETSSLREQTKIGSHLLLPQQKQQQQHVQHKHKEPYPFQRSSSARDRAVKGDRSINHDLVNVKQHEIVTSGNISCISHSSAGSSTCNDTYTTTGSRVTDKPLVCLQYMTQQLYEMANGVNLPAATTEHHYQSSIISQCPWTDSVAKEATLLSTTLASAATSMMTYSVTDSSSSSTPTETSSPTVSATNAVVGDPATPTAITKRRRKEDATASGDRRYSPEKQKRRAHQYQLRESLSQSGSLLDGQSQTAIDVNCSSSPSRKRLEEAANMHSSSSYANMNDNTYMMDDNDDDQSELEGYRIPLHGQQQQLTPNSTTLSPIQNYHMQQQSINHLYGTKQDDLSYTYSESEASPRPVAKDLLQELVWEKLNDNDDDGDVHHDQNDDQHSYGGESYDSSQKGLATTTAVGFATLVTPPSVSHGAKGSSRIHPDLQGTSSLVGEVITVTGLEKGKQQESINSRLTNLRSSNRKKKKSTTVECRRVSDCSSNDSASSSSSSSACESVSLTSSQEDHSLSVSSSTSCTASSSERSNDSGVIFDRQQDIADRNIALRSNISPARRVHFQLDRLHGNEDANNCARDPYAQVQNSSTTGSKKRKEQSSPSSSPSQKLRAPTALSPSRIHDRNRARRDDYQNNDHNSFLFPLQHVFSVESLAAGSTSVTSDPMGAPNADKAVSSRQHPVLQPRRRASSANGDKSNDSDASILVDLTKDLKDIALYAGKSSGDLVTSLYHTLCEE